MSTHREIKEVYLEEIIKKQKQTKTIVAEKLGELQGKKKKRRKKKSTTA